MRSKTNMANETGTAAAIPDNQDTELPGPSSSKHSRKKASNSARDAGQSSSVAMQSGPSSACLEAKTQTKLPKPKIDLRALFDYHFTRKQHRFRKRWNLMERKPSTSCRYVRKRPGRRRIPEDEQRKRMKERGIVFPFVERYYGRKHLPLKMVRQYEGCNFPRPSFKMADAPKRSRAPRAGKSHSAASSALTSRSKQGKQALPAKEASRAEEEDASGQQEALEKQIAKVQKASRIRSPVGETSPASHHSAVDLQDQEPGPSSRAMAQTWSSDAVEGDPTQHPAEGRPYGDLQGGFRAVPWQEQEDSRPGVEATFTPTAAGLRPAEPSELDIPVKIRLLVDRAIRKGISKGIQQLACHSSEVSEASVIPPREQVALLSERGSLIQEHVSPVVSAYAPSVSAAPSLARETEKWKSDMSEDEDLTPEIPEFAGLFKPTLFSRLLFKARNTANLKEADDEDSAVQPPMEPDGLFGEPTMRNEVVPSPRLFLKVVQKQLESPTSGLNPLSTNCRFFNVGPELTKSLQVPMVDAPVAALASTSTAPCDLEDVLKAEEERIEQSLQRSHQAAAWAVKASTAASFFTRTSLKWLKQLQDRIPNADIRTHQDLYKIVAAAEFTADATLDVVKFATKAIASSVVARRMCWLRNWQADGRRKWKLASSPVQGDKLFGEALDPFLVESKHKRKVLPSLYKRAENGPAPYFRHPSFRAESGSSFHQFAKSSYQCPEPPSDRSDKDRHQFLGKRPFQGGGSCLYRQQR
uniref:TATA box-binding protein-associated factor RNA polymerase I subunit D n=1 Tax=Naja naja TaxID=35670 RepID=A0A8C6X389_NAJNA